MRLACCDSAGHIKSTADVSSTPTPVGTHPSATAAPGRCTDPQMTTQAVIERDFELSTGNDPQAVADRAKVWRDKTATFADGAAPLSNAPPSPAPPPTAATGWIT